MKTLFVDLDHTVMLNPFHGGVFPALGRAISAAAPSRPAPEAVQRRLIQRSLQLLNARTIAANDWDAIAREVAREHGAAWTGRVVEFVRQNLDHAQLVPGALDALDAARSRGWRVVAASQGFREYQTPVVEHLGLARLFDAELYTDDTRSLKRSTRFYGRGWHAAKRVVVIGDQFVDDYAYPEHFGMTAIWFTGVRTTRTLALVRPPRFHLGALEDLASTLDVIDADPTCAYRPIGPARCCACLGPAERHAQRCSLCAVTDTGPPGDSDVLRKRALACIRDGRLLLCRARAFPWLITVGGLESGGETVVETLSREVAEELGADARLRADTLEPIGRFRGRAAGAPDREVEVELWHADLDGPLRAGHEIGELIWWGRSDGVQELSPVVRDAIVPALVQRGLL
jgi:FMN phosphatase YigB (HAD superfamily)/8-oxo-dGTP pyrophosphatase MutT (NUDIX family)